MSEATSVIDSRRDRPSGHHRRRYLVDPRFQLKYTGLLVGVVIAVMAGLGGVIWQTAKTASEQAHYAASQAERALRESENSSRMLRMDAISRSVDNPEALRTLERELAEIDRQAVINAAQVQQHRMKIDRQERRMLYVLVSAAVLLILVLSVLGIFITLRIVGPVYKLKRLLRRVGTGRLVLTEKLRKGDELEDLFDTFMQMAWSLRAMQMGRLATLEATLAKAEAANVPPDVISGLRAMRAQMRLGLRGAVHSMAPPPPTH